MLRTFAAFGLATVLAGSFIAPLAAADPIRLAQADAGAPARPFDGAAPAAGTATTPATSPAAAPATVPAAGTAAAPATPAAADGVAAAPDAGTAAPPADAAPAGEPAWRHASALTGEPRYPAGFPHFDYVDPAAPKGGRVRLGTPAAFDSFNPLRSRDNQAPGLTLVFQTLMAPAEDEQNISAQYGLIAAAMRYPADYSWVEYRLDPAARWHDGTPVTVDDVVFSFDAAKQVNPSLAYYYEDVTKAEAIGDDVVRFTFARPGNRELPQIVGQLLVVPKAWWTGTAPDGTPRDIARGTLEPPLGSGPYRIANFEAGRAVEYARVPDAWSARHPTQVGKHNFDALRFEVFRDPNILVEALKGDRLDYRQENSARNWAFSYDFPAAARGDVVRETFPQRATGIMQAFVMNLRLPKFQDQRVRRALNLMYDFEAQKSAVFYDQYHRIGSYFEGTELASSGLPEGRELAILESVRDKVPASVFTTPYENPVGGTPQRARDNARAAVALFREAGYEIRGGRMVDAAGKPFTIDFVAESPQVDRYVLPYVEALRRIGVTVNYRLVDTTQLQQMERERNFEMIVDLWAQSLSPGNEQRGFWGSAAADQPSSRNTAGIKDPGVDALIERVILATDRDDLVAATRALDRVLLAHDYVVPLFASGEARTIRWNRFGHPANLPPYGALFPDVWWWDAAKAATVRGAR